MAPGGMPLVRVRVMVRVRVRVRVRVKVSAPHRRYAWVKVRRLGG